MYGKVFKLGQSSMLSSRKDLKQLIPSGSEVKLGSHLQILRVSSYVRSIIQSGKLIKLGRYLMLSFSYLPLSYLVSISLLSFYYSSCYKKQVNLNLKRKCVPLFWIYSHSQLFVVKLRWRSENSPNKSSASITASLSFSSQSLTWWLWFCCSAASSSTAWIMETVFFYFFQVHLWHPRAIQSLGKSGSPDLQSSSSVLHQRGLLQPFP